MLRRQIVAHQKQIMAPWQNCNSLSQFCIPLHYNGDKTSSYSEELRALYEAGSEAYLRFCTLETDEVLTRKHRIWISQKYFVYLHWQSGKSL